MVNQQLIENISKEQWIKRWAGSYTFTSCSFWAPQYDHVLNKLLGIGFKASLFIHRKGLVTFLLKNDELENFGKTLAKKAEQNPGFAIDILKKLKNNTTEIMMKMQELDGKIPSWKDYQDFLVFFEIHLAYHNFMKKSVDYMDNDVLNDLINYFKDARFYSEPVYSRSEVFFRGIAKAIAKKENFDSNILTCLTQQELETYLKTEKLPEESILKDRFNASVLLFEDGKLNILIGEEVDEIEKVIHEVTENSSDEEQGILRGIPAFPGKVKAIARIIPDPYDVSEFNEGEILITGMTRPEFLPLMKRAAGIVTDVGGMLCHAALVSRELKKPCIVGTNRATRFFKDGDLLELDADKGIVKKL
jgi:phosphohistidine swiveling domain-containing protein